MIGPSEKRKSRQDCKQRRKAADFRRFFDGLLVLLTGPADHTPLSGSGTRRPQAAVAHDCIPWANSVY